LGFHCPEPVPATYLTAMLLNGSPHPNAAKLYLNWRLSKEGQVAAWYSKGTPPVHKDLQKDAFVQFPEEILGRKVALRTEELMNNEMPILAKIWDEHWQAAGK
jgi:ABC-type Fe3+ transport system substrate-binding protein